MRSGMFPSPALLLLNDARARTLIYWGGPDKVLFVTVENFNRPQDPFYLFFD